MEKYGDFVTPGTLEEQTELDRAVELLRHAYKYGCSSDCDCDNCDAVRVFLEGYDARH